MKTGLRVEGEITAVAPLPEDDLKLTEEDLKGAGLTAEEIALSPEIGAWAGGGEEQSGAEYVEKLRRMAFPASPKR